MSNELESIVVAPVGFLCFAVLIGLPIILLVAALVLRGAVSISNRSLGVSKHKDYEFDDFDDEDDDEDWLPPPSGRGMGMGDAIPLPSIGRGMFIVFTSSVVSVVGSFLTVLLIGVLLVANGPGNPMGPLGLGGQELFILMSLPIGFLIIASINSMLLPTTFGRGCRVAFFYYLLWFAIVLVVGVPLFAFGMAFGA
jgi:hypothetical protein